MSQKSSQIFKSMGWTKVETRVWQFQDNQSDNSSTRKKNQNIKLNKFDSFPIITKSFHAIQPTYWMFATVMYQSDESLTMLILHNEGR